MMPNLGQGPAATQIGLPKRPSLLGKFGRKIQKPKAPTRPNRMVLANAMSSGNPGQTGAC